MEICSYDWWPLIIGGRPSTGEAMTDPKPENPVVDADALASVRLSNEVEGSMSEPPAPDAITHQGGKMKTKTERPVIVTTAHRGVFFGYAADTDGETIALKRSRLCVYWSADCKGFMGLAANGPTDSCRIGPPADITLRNITSVMEVTSAAVAAWESAPWK